MGSEQPILEAEGPIRHKLTVAEFLILDEAGAFDTKHVELIDGEIYFLSPIHFPHARTVAVLTAEVEMTLRRVAPALQACSPVSAEFDEHNLPEADLIVVAPGDEKFVSPASVRLVVEVSASSLRHDLVRKAALYARGGVPEYWVVDVNGRRVIRLHAPADGAFGERTEFAFGDTVPSATINGLIVDTTALP